MNVVILFCFYFIFFVTVVGAVYPTLKIILQICVYVRKIWRENTHQVSFKIASW